MKLLLDTPSFLWWVTADESLSKQASSLIQDKENEVFVSVVTLWDMVQLIAEEKIHLSQSLDRILEEEIKKNMFSVLSLQMKHLLDQEGGGVEGSDTVALLARQAYVEKVPVLTCNPTLVQYPILTIW